VLYFTYGSTIKYRAALNFRLNLALPIAGGSGAGPISTALNRADGMWGLKGWS